jgi:hypothetical protein
MPANDGMRVVIFFILIIALAACSDVSDRPLDASIEDDDQSERVEPDAPLEDDSGTEGYENASHAAPVLPNDTLIGAPDFSNSSLNLTSPDPNGSAERVAPRALLGESFLGFVPSSDSTPRIVSFSLIDVATNRVLGGFENMTGIVRIDRERVPRRLAVRANYAGEVGSVLFSLDEIENHRVENEPPFASHGVDFFGQYSAWIPDRGRYTLTATPFERSQGVGPSYESTTLIIEFYAPGYLDRVPNP